MTVNNLLIYFINSMAHAICFAELLYNVYVSLTKQRFRTILLAGILLIAGMLTCLISDVYIMITMIVTSFIYLIINKIPKVQALICCVITTVICIANLWIMSLIYYALNLPMDRIAEFRLTLEYNFSMSVCYVAITFLDIFILHIVNRKIQYDPLGNGENVWGKFLYVIMIVVLFLLCVLAVFSMGSLVIDSNDIRAYLLSCNISALMITMLSAIIGVFVLFSVLIIYMSYRFMKQRLRELSIQKDKEITSIYKNEIQKMYNEISDFKHDYMKIYSSMSMLIANNKSKELKEYFSENITPLQEKIMSERSISHNLTLIEDEIIQGLVYTYVLRARNSNIDFYVAIEQKIKARKNISSVDLSRMLGILLDNAFEAANNISHGMVRLIISDSDNTTIYAVHNSCDKDLRMQDILSGSYTTKGEGRGRGLRILKSICDKHKNTLFNINCHQDLFEAEIIIGSDLA